MNLTPKYCEFNIKNIYFSNKIFNLIIKYLI